MSSFRPIPASYYVLGTVLTHIDQAVRMSWPWLLVLAGARAATLALMPERPANLESDSAALISYALDVLWYYLFYSLLSTVAFASIAVNWHRYMLEERTPEGIDLMRIDAPVWRYVGNMMLIYCSVAFLFGLAIVPMKLAAGHAAVLAGEGLAALAAGAIVVAVLAWLGLAMLRLAIKLPAVAVERGDYGFFQAWLDSGGNAFRMLGFVFLVLIGAGLPFLAIEVAILFVLSFAGEGAVVAGALVLEIAAAWLIVLVLATMLSVLYAVFAEGREL